MIKMYSIAVHDAWEVIMFKIVLFLSDLNLSNQTMKSKKMGEITQTLEAKVKLNVRIGFGDVRPWKKSASWLVLLLMSRLKLAHSISEKSFFCTYIVHSITEKVDT